MTFKILFNDAVAMTGGQSVDGPLTPGDITRQVLAEGAVRCVVVTDRPDLYGAHSGLGDGVTVHHRDTYDRVQRELRDVPGVTVIVYEQTCAAEKRRRRKRGKFPRSEEHTSELQSLMRISYAVFCLKKKKNKQT